MKKSKKIFKVGSLIDPDGDYVGHFDARTGELLYHTFQGQKGAPVMVEISAETKTNDPKQQSLF